jgi:hypothetical protein
MPEIFLSYLDIRNLDPSVSLTPCLIGSTFQIMLHVYVPKSKINGSYCKGHTNDMDDRI